MTKDNIEGEDVEFEDCVVMAVAEKSILVGIPDYGGEIWVPKKVLGRNNEIAQKGDNGTLAVAGWWASAEDLI